MSAVTPRWPSKIIVTRFIGTSSAFDKALADTPRASSSSRNTSPGCHRPHSILRVHVCFSSVVIHDLYIARPVVGPTETDAPLRIDPDAVLTAAVTPQGFQSVTAVESEV